MRLTRGTVVVELDTSGTVDVAAERRRLEKIWPPPRRSSRHHRQARQRSLLAKARRCRRQDSRPASSPARKSKESRPGWHLCNDGRRPDAGRNRLATPSRAPPRPAWPETKLEPSTARISALMAARPAAARLSVDPHRGHQRQDVGGPHGRCAADRAAPTVPGARPALTCIGSSGSRSTSRSRPLSTSPPTKRSNRSSNWSTSSPKRRAGPR